MFKLLLIILWTTLLTVTFSFVASLLQAQVPTPIHAPANCTIYTNIVRTDSTYYEVECGNKAKIKEIVEEIPARV